MITKKKKRVSSVFFIYIRRFGQQKRMKKRIGKVDGNCWRGKSDNYLRNSNKERRLFRPINLDLQASFELPNHGFVSSLRSLWPRSSKQMVRKYALFLVRVFFAQITDSTRPKPVSSYDKMMANERKVRGQTIIRPKSNNRRRKLVDVNCQNVSR